MKVSWKGISRVDDGDEPLLLVTLRTETDLVITASQLNNFYVELNQLQESGAITVDTVSTISMEFETMHALLTGLRDGPPAVKHANLESPWVEFPLKQYDIVLPLLKRTFASNAFFRIDGKAPNFTLVYQFGEETKTFPIQPTDLENAAAIVASVTESSLQFGVSEVLAGHLTIPEAVAVTAVVAVVIPGATFGVAVGIAAIATGAVTAAQVLTYMQIIVAALTAATLAQKLYLEHEKAKSDRAEEARIRREIQRVELQTTRVWMIAGDEMTKASGMV